MASGRTTTVRCAPSGRDSLPKRASGCWPVFSAGTAGAPYRVTAVPGSSPGAAVSFRPARGVVDVPRRTRGTRRFHRRVRVADRFPSRFVCGSRRGSARHRHTRPAGHLCGLAPRSRSLRTSMEPDISATGSSRAPTPPQGRRTHEATRLDMQPNGCFARGRPTPLNVVEPLCRKGELAPPFTRTSTVRSRTRRGVAT